jgi:hypothetical protein
LDPYPDRNRDHTDHIEPPSRDITSRASTIRPGLSKLMKSSSC